MAQQLRAVLFFVFHLNVVSHLVLPSSASSRVQLNLDLHLQKIKDGQAICSSTRTKLQLNIDPPTIPRLAVNLKTHGTVSPGYKESNCAHCGLNIPTDLNSVAINEISICRKYQQHITNLVI